MGLLYLAKNKVNGKGYIGCTRFNWLSTRQREHRSDALVYNSKMAFHCAIRKYGWESFEWSILFEGLDEEDLEVYERAYIKKLDTQLPNGYNMTPGGEGRANPIGWKHSPETIEKLRQKALNRSPEVRKAMSEAQKGKKYSPERRAKCALGFLGKKHSEATKQILREKATGRPRPPLTDAQRAKLSESAKKRTDDRSGRKASAETKAKMSVSQKKRHPRKPMTPETKAKMVASLKRVFALKREAKLALKNAEKADREVLKSV